MAVPGKVIAIGNLKGGVGKSTLAVNLGCALATRGQDTLLIDTDPQQTAMAWTRLRRLPCQVRARPLRELGAVGAWLDELAAARRTHERILIDLPAVLSPALAAAFMAADAILIPTSFSPIDLEATRRTVRRAQVAQAERPRAPPVILAVPMLVRRGWLGRPQPVAPRHRLLPVPTTPAIGFDPMMAEAFERGDWIGGLAPHSRACRELLAVADLLEIGLAGGPVATAPTERPDALDDDGSAEPAPAQVGSRRRRLTAMASL